MFEDIERFFPVCDCRSYAKAIRAARTSQADFGAEDNHIHLRFALERWHSEAFAPMIRQSKTQSRVMLSSNVRKTKHVADLRAKHSVQGIGFIFFTMSEAVCDLICETTIKNVNVSCHIMSPCSWNLTNLKSFNVVLVALLSVAFLQSSAQRLQ